MWTFAIKSWRYMSWTFRGSNPGGDDMFRTLPDRRLVPPILIYSGNWVSFRGGTVPRVWCYPPASSSAEVKERVQLYLYSPSGPSWPVLG